MPLTISVATASADLKESAIANAITVLAVQVAATSRAGLVPAQPSLDITFLLPGRLDKPAFTGMRMGGYTREHGTLFFERAVEEPMLYSQQSAAYVALVMSDVIENADDFCRDNQLAFDGGRWRELLALLTCDTGNLN